MVPGEGRRALAEACRDFGLTLSDIGGMLKLFKYIREAAVRTAASLQMAKLCAPQLLFRVADG